LSATKALWLLVLEYGQLMVLLGQFSRLCEVSVKADNKNKKAGALSSAAPEKTEKENKAITSFENFFYRYVAWFPILVLPALVWDMMAEGQTIPAVLIGLMHAVLVFRFVQVVNVAGWFGKKGTA
jgi:fatty-acid desaturase